MELKPLLSLAHSMLCPRSSASPMPVLFIILLMLVFIGLTAVEVLTSFAIYSLLIRMGYQAYLIYLFLMIIFSLQIVISAWSAVLLTRQTKDNLPKEFYNSSKAFIMAFLQGFTKKDAA